MANLSYQESIVLEELFEMHTGYVIDFSNRTFERFVKGVVNIDVYNDIGYQEYSSKANKLRQIFSEEPDGVVGLLVDELLSYYEDVQLKKQELTEYQKKKSVK